MSNEELIRLIRGGKRELMGELYTRNIGFIQGIIRRGGLYPDKRPEDFEDAMQDAYFGLYEAAVRFDESKGYKFLTYAEWYIRCRVNAGRNAIIRLPQAVKRDIIKIEAVRAELAQKLKYAPTAEEISQQTGIAVERIKYLQRTVKPVQSIYEPICNAEDLTVEDGIEDDSIHFEDDIADTDERRYVQKLVSELSRQKRKIIELFYFSGMTLKQIAAAEPSYRSLCP